MEKEKNVEINTIPRLFWDSVVNKSNKIAMREKHLGIWQSTTWEEYGSSAKKTGLALHSLGLRKGEVVSIASEGIPEWLFTDMATIAVGGISSGHECYEKIKAGASLVQLYTALVYQGPKIVDKILKDLNELITVDGYKNISDAIGKSS